MHGFQIFMNQNTFIFELYFLGTLWWAFEYAKYAWNSKGHPVCHRVTLGYCYCSYFPFLTLSDFYTKIICSEKNRNLKIPNISFSTGSLLSSAYKKQRILPQLKNVHNPALPKVGHIHCSRAARSSHDEPSTQLILVIQEHAPVPGDTQFIPSVQRTGNAALPFVKTKKTWYIYKPSLLLSPLAKTKCRGLHALILCKYIVWMILFARKNRLKYVWKQ